MCRSKPCFGRVGTVVSIFPINLHYFLRNVIEFAVNGVHTIFRRRERRSRRNVKILPCFFRRSHPFLWRKRLSRHKFCRSHPKFAVHANFPDFYLQECMNVIKYKIYIFKILSHPENENLFIYFSVYVRLFHVKHF